MTFNRSAACLIAGTLLFVALSSSPGSAGAQESADQIARELANPNTTRGTFSFPFDFVNYGGTLPDAGGQNAFKISAQPSLPYPLGAGVNFFLRPLIPVVFSQPAPTEGGFEDRGVALGDIGFDAAVGKTFSSGLVLVGGVVGSMPTSTDDQLGLDQWLLGPEALLAKVWDWGVLGALVTQSWRVGGNNTSDTSITGGQYFVTVNLGGGWQISGQPVWSYNHQAAEGDRLTFPLGSGVSRTMLLGSTPWKFGLQYWYYVASPDAFGPRHQVRFSVAPVVPLPW